MIKKLKNIYPSLIVYDYEDQLHTNNNVSLNSEYIWYITDDKKIIGIKENELTKKDNQLLNAFLTPYKSNLPHRSTIEDRWYKRIHEHTNEETTAPFRFVFFELQHDSIQPHVFANALHELFSKEIPIIWHNDSEGIIIEETSLTDEQINFHQIIDVLMSDISVKIKFFIGQLHDNYDNLHNTYYTLIETAQTVFRYSDQIVIDYLESIPYLLIRNITDQEKTQLITTGLKHFRHDEEMLKTLQVFLQSNLNVSEAAKNLYMHRNSLQYRIDKFVNETNINVQQFDQAVAVQFAIIANHVINGYSNES